jgi:Fe2+ or Zn2+ uptake regulation protein
LDEVCDAIAIYVAQHPHAADTARGVSEQWLGGFNSKVSRQLVVRALELLVQQGKVRRHLLVGGTELYASDSHRASVLREFLEGETGD